MHSTRSRPSTASTASSSGRPISRQHLANSATRTIRKFRTQFATSSRAQRLRKNRPAFSRRSRRTHAVTSNGARHSLPSAATSAYTAARRKRCATNSRRRDRSSAHSHHWRHAMKIGFVGLGIMGTPMAEHLINGGHELYLYSIPSVPSSLVRAGGKACASGKEAAQKSDVVFIMVPDTPHVGAALFDENGIAAGLSAGKIVVDMSSISPVETKVYAKKVNALGCDYLDAPVSGGEVGAKAASLTIMVGGPEAAFEKVKPLFASMGKNVTLVGGNGD